MLGEVGDVAPVPTIKANRTFENWWLTVAAPWAAFTVPFDEVELSQYCAPHAPGRIHIIMSPPAVMVTMDVKQNVELLRLIKPDGTIPIHYDDYKVFASPLEKLSVARLLGRAR